MVNKKSAKKKQLKKIKTAGAGGRYIAKDQVKDKGKGKGGGKGDKAKKAKGEGKGDKADLYKKKPKKIFAIEEAPAAAGDKAKGKKRKSSALTGDVEEAAGPKRGKKFLNEKKALRKEITTLYNELITSQRDRKADLIVEDIMEVLKSRPDTLDTYCSKRIGSRVLQACLKWGSKKQRRQLLLQLKDFIAPLSTDRYGHVVVQKLLVYISKTAAGRKPTKEEAQAQSQNLKDYMKGFQGNHLHGTFFHRKGCNVINSIYYSPVVSPKDKRRILHDVAVPAQVALLRPEVPGSKTLRQLLKAEDLNEEQRKEIVDHLQECCEKSIDKELLGLDMVHLLWQAFCEVGNESQMKDLVDKAMAGVPHMLSSKPGAEAVCRLVGYANAKHKKNFCRDLKGKFAALAMNAVDYLVVLRLALTVDDTVMMTKGMLAELIAEMDNLCMDKYGYRVLTWLLRPDDPRYFSPYERECLASVAPTAVKQADTRRQELIRIVRPPLRAALLKNPLVILADAHAQNLLCAYMASEWDAELLDALLKACEKEATTADFGVLNTTAATTGLLALLKIEPADTKEPLALPLWQRCFEAKPAEVAASRCVRVVLALLKHEQASKVILKVVKSQKKEIEAAAKAREAKGEVVTGIRQLLAAA